MVRGHAKRAGGGGRGIVVLGRCYITHGELIFERGFFLFLCFLSPFSELGFSGVLHAGGVGLMDFLHGCVSSRVDRMARSAFHP